MKKHLLVLMIAFLCMTTVQAQSVAAKDAAGYVGKTVTICGKVFGGRYFEKNGRTLLNVGGTYPDNPLTIVMDETTRKKFSFKPEEWFLHKEVCVTGEVVDYKGKPEVVVTEVTQLVTTDNPVQ